MSIQRTAILLALFLAHLNPAGADDWPNWRGSNLDGISKEIDWDVDKIDNIAWSADIGIGFASVAVVGGKLYTLGHNGDKGEGGKETVICLDAKTGNEIWKSQYAAKLLPNLHEGGPASTPTVDGGRLFTLSKDGRLICFDAATGRRHWDRTLLKEAEMEKPAEWGFASSPLIVGDLVVIEGARTLAIDIKSGKVRWKSDRYQPAYGTPTPFEFRGRKLLATVKNDGLVVLDAKDGKTVAFEEWKTRFSTNANTPIVRGAKIFVSTGYGRGCGLFQFNGEGLEEIYTNKNMSNHMSGCVLIGKQLYGFDGNTHTGRVRQLRCIDFSTGKVLWTQTGLGIGAVRAAGDRLIILSEKGELAVAVAKADKYHQLSRAQVSKGRHWNVPVLSGGFIYVRNAVGILTAIDVRG